MSFTVLSYRVYTAKRRHGRTCFACGDEIRVGDECVVSAVADRSWGRAYSTVEHKPCADEASRLNDGDDNGYSEHALDAYWGTDDWSPEYAAWRADRAESNAPVKL